ncbi:hypothetical protein FHR70_000684 [Microvirga lupini]|uniref:Uncharacterized protein n=1 Tax=Microvirga lupini TaxID=420324 RepID=A0A7W4YVX3_9HYPH|nr:hypothetical protein [Microvirga lupini]MBB3017644.1 hypothetical protein [Microvirga lupini]
MIRATTLLLAVAAAGLLAKAPAAIMPTRRPEWQPGYDMNALLDDAGRRAERALRKVARRSKLQQLQAQAAGGAA